MIEHMTPVEFTVQPELIVRLVEAASKSKTTELELAVAHYIRGLFSPPLIYKDDKYDAK